MLSSKLFPCILCIACMSFIEAPSATQFPNQEGMHTPSFDDETQGEHYHLESGTKYKKSAG